MDRSAVPNQHWIIVLRLNPTLGAIFSENETATDQSCDVHVFIKLCLCSLFTGIQSFHLKHEPQ